MIVLPRQHIGKDVSTATEYMKKWSTKSHCDTMKFINSDIYSLEFQFICEDDEDKKYYWLRMWRVRKKTDFLNQCIISILKGEEVTAYKK